ncbi:MAG: hypothetical protein FJ045_05735, partial [Crenarchaeota archaeon]|nr:hypothetical protein [Thermoproteota archaeon]
LMELQSLLKNVQSTCRTSTLPLRDTSALSLGFLLFQAGEDACASKIWQAANLPRDGVILLLASGKSDSRLLSDLVKLTPSLGFTSNQGKARLAAFLEERNEKQAASEIWDEAAHFLPESPENHWFYVGEFYKIKGNWLEAVTAFRQCELLSPTNPLYRQRETSAWMELERWDEAAVAAEEWRRLSSFSYESVATSGRIAFEKHEYSEAEMWFQLAIRTDSSKPFAFAEMGRVKSAEQQYEQAVPYLIRAIQIDSNHEDAFSQLLDNYVRLGKWSEAGSLYRIASGRFPGFELRNQSTVSTLLEHGSGY